MKNSSNILKFIKNKKTYELRKKFIIFQSIFTGLIVASIVIFFDLVKVIFNYLAAKGSSDIPDLQGANVASQLFVFILMLILTIIIGIYFFKNISFYFSLKERGIDKLNRKKALKIIEEESEEIESV